MNPPKAGLGGSEAAVLANIFGTGACAPNIEGFAASAAGAVEAWPNANIEGLEGSDTAGVLELAVNDPKGMIGFGSSCCPALEVSKGGDVKAAVPSPPNGLLNGNPLVVEAPNMEEAAGSSFVSPPKIETGCVEVELETPNEDGLVLSLSPMLEPLVFDLNKDGWGPVLLFSPSQNGLSLSFKGVDVGVMEGAGAGVDGNNIVVDGLGTVTGSVDGDDRGVGSDKPNDGMAEGRREPVDGAAESNLLEAKKFGTPSGLEGL